MLPANYQCVLLMDYFIDKSDLEDERQLEVEHGDFVSALHALTPSITPQELAKYKNISTNLS